MYNRTYTHIQTNCHVQKYISTKTKMKQWREAENCITQMRKRQQSLMPSDTKEVQRKTSVSHSLSLAGA